MKKSFRRVGRLLRQAECVITRFGTALLIQSKRHIRMAVQDKLRIELKYGDLQQRVLAIRNFLGELK